MRDNKKNANKKKYAHKYFTKTTARANTTTSAADANCNNFVPRCPIATNDTPIESQKQGLHVPFVGISIAPPVVEFEATRAEAT
jgi:hypothetical protein